MKRYSQDSFGDMRIHPTGKYVLYSDIKISTVDLNIVEELQSMINEYKSLLDSAIEIVELYKVKTPAQVEWKKNWLRNVLILTGGGTVKNAHFIENKEEN